MRGGLVALALGLGCSGGEKAPGDGSTGGQDTSDRPTDTDTDSDSDTDTDTDTGEQPWGPVAVPLGVAPPDDLAELRLFTWDPATGTTTFNEGVVPYTLNTPLFSDEATKLRAVYVPDGQAMTYDEDDALGFPVGSLILKNFSLPADLRAPDEDVRLIETRLLIKQETGWEQWPYVWEEDGSAARLDLGGEVFSTSFIDLDGETVAFTYLVPQKNQCAECHELAGGAGEEDRFITPIGPKARHLNRDEDHGDGPVNQLEHFASLGMLSGLPAIEQVDAAVDADTVGDPTALDDEALEAAARDYLDISCAHCHNPAGVNGISSQLFLNHDNTDPFTLGVCKAPGSAGEGTGGFSYDIVPGNPEESILVFRMRTEELGAMMPLLGRSLVDDAGVALVSEWIRRMEPEACD